VRFRFAFALFLLAYALLLPSFSAHMQERPIEIKLGYVPHPKVIKLATADFAPVLAELAIVKVLFYYGSLVDQWTKQVIIRPEFFNMFKTLQTATILDPYNMDAYYFCQAAFTWELGRARDVNVLLDHGMQYRTWDPWLPFYAGFNAGYFLKDYPAAAKYMRRAAEISGNPLFTRLAARYFYESDQTDIALAFLDSMISGAKDPAVKRTYEVRKQALLAVSMLENAVAKYRSKTGKTPQSLQDLVRAGIIQKLPRDPYGGEFYLDDHEKVRSSSKLANAEL
jgi:hypothetical protein